MGINFQGVLNFVDFVGSLHPQKMLTWVACTHVKTMHAVAICHEYIHCKKCSVLCDTAEC